MYLCMTSEDQKGRLTERVTYMLPENLFEILETVGFSQRSKATDFARNVLLSHLLDSGEITDVDLAQIPRFKYVSIGVGA